jgi:adsorption protein B
MLKLMNYQNGQFLKEGSLTEDYFLGQTIYQLGLSSQFACFYKENSKTRKKDFIATYEYFPNTFQSSVKQKTRWNIGIICQGWEYLGWQGSWLEKYFFWRDRRGVINSLLVILSFLCLGYFAFRDFYDVPASKIESSSLFTSLVVFNFIAFFWRMFHRARALYQVHQSSMIFLAPIRWILANVINTSATIRALKQYIQSRISDKAIVWSKTDHQLPAMLIYKAQDMAQKIANQNANQLVLNKSQLTSAALESLDFVTEGSIEPVNLNSTNLEAQNFTDLAQNSVSTLDIGRADLQGNQNGGSTNELVSP